MNREDYEFVLGLLREGKVDAARRYLEDSDESLAKEWLNQLKAPPALPKKAKAASSTIKPLQPKKAAKPVTKPVVSVATVGAAWVRDIAALPDKSVLIGAGVAGVVIIAIALLVMPTATLVIGIMAGIALSLYMGTAQEITSVVVETGRVERHYDWMGWQHLKLWSKPAREVKFPKQTFSLKYPPSAGLMSVMGVRDLTHSAALLLRGTLVGLWGQGYFQLWEVVLDRVGIDGNSHISAPTYFILPGSQLDDVRGGLERLLATKVAYWKRSNPQAVASHPWRQGPTPHELVVASIGEGKAAQLFEALRREMVESKTYNPKTGTFADGLKADGEAIMRALAVLGKEQREVDVAIQTQILKAVKTRSS